MLALGRDWRKTEGGSANLLGNHSLANIEKTAIEENSSCLYSGLQSQTVGKRNYIRRSAGGRRAVEPCMLRLKKLMGKRLQNIII